MNRWIGIATALLLLTVWRSAGFHQADEHFQILEFAVHKAGGATADDLPWEFAERMRPALQPAMAYLVYEGLGGWGRADPFLVAFLLRLLSAALAVWVSWRVWTRYRTVTFLGSRYLLAGLLLFHWMAYYNGARFSSENWSGLLATLGFLTYPLRFMDRRQFIPPGGGSAFGAGILFGLAFLCRYQIGLLIAGFGLWLLIYQWREWRSILLAIAGGVVMLVAAYPLTYWLYGEWTLPAWNYLSQNLIEGKAAGYGTRPWYAYLELIFLRGIPPLSLLYIVGFGVFAYAFRRDPITFMWGVFLLVHSVLARKDIRFLFPLVPMIPIVLAAAAHFIERTYGRGVWNRKWIRVLAYLSAGVNFVLLLATLVRAPASEIAPARFVYRNYPNEVTLSGPEARIVRAEGTISRFYHRPAYRVDTIVSRFDGTCAPPPCLYVIRERGTPGTFPDASLVYTDRPRWLDRLGLSEYVDRLKWWYIYERR